MATDRQIWEVSEPYLDLHCLLGEGPFYEADTNRLRFVDIRKKQLHTVDLAVGPSSLQSLQLDEPISVTADVEGLDSREKIVVGLKYGIALLDRKTGKYEYLGRFSEASEASEAGVVGEADKASISTDFERTRGNDGAADPQGRFWLGTMTDFGLGEEQAEGSLFLFRDGHSCERVIAGLTIPNSVGFSPDGRTMYFTHTTEKVVYGFDYDTASGGLSNKRVVYRHTEPGWPDGFRVDTDGFLWHAFYGGSSVLKINPANGSIVGEIRLPTPNITCPQFVGTDLFITTAEDGEHQDSAKQNLGGALFRVNVGATGLPLYKVRLGA